MKSAVHREGDRICCPRDLVPCSAGGLDQIGTGLVSPGDLSIDTDAETIKDYYTKQRSMTMSGGAVYRRTPPC